MATKYIVDNLTGQTITGDITINGNLTVTGTSNNSGTYRALLTQTGSISGNSGDFNNRLIIGETYEITDYATYDDFSNVADIQSGRIITFNSLWIIPESNSYYPGLIGTTNGSGIGATFDVSTDGFGGGSFSIASVGIDYVINDTITILGTDIGGTSPLNDILITITDSTPFAIETGCVFIATGDTPVIWGNSILTSVGDLIVDVLENTLGDELVWVYDPESFTFQEGVYLAALSEFINFNNICNTFTIDKTQITTPTLITPFNSLPQSFLKVTSGVGTFSLPSTVNAPLEGIIFLSIYNFGTSSFSGNSLYYTPIEIKLNSITTQEETPLISINWSSYSGETDFNDNIIQIPSISNVRRFTISKCGNATAHVHEQWESSDLKIELYDDSINDWVTVWSYTLYNTNFDFAWSPYLNLSGNIDVTFTNITSVSGIRVTSDPGSGFTYHNWGGLVFNFFN